MRDLEIELQAKCLIYSLIHMPLPLSWRQRKLGQELFRFLAARNPTTNDPEWKRKNLLLRGGSQ